jgi:hypothetical protein
VPLSRPLRPLEVRNQGLCHNSVHRIPESALQTTDMPLQCHLTTDEQQNALNKCLLQHIRQLISSMCTCETAERV